jgi:chemotaxis protein histidine kinase CheA
VIPNRQTAIARLKAARTYRANFANGNSRDFAALVAAWRAGNYDARTNMLQSLDDFLQIRNEAGVDDPLDLLIAETVNEILQGQIGEGNESLLDALRTRYPRIADFDPDNPPNRLPPPEGNVRAETEDLDRAIESFAHGYRAALSVLPVEGGDELLRAASEQFPGFPQFTTMTRPFTDNPNLNLSNEYPVQVELSHLSRCADRAGQASVEKGKKLFNISSRPDDPNAREDAVTELKRGAHHAYILSAALGAVQTEQQYMENGGEKQLVHTALARQLFRRIQEGLTPFGNSKNFIPNGSISNFISRAQGDVSEARNAEIAARQEQRNYDLDQASLRNELQAQRDSFLSPLTLLTNLDPREDQDLDFDGVFGEAEPEGEDLDGDGNLGEYEAFDSLQTVRGRALYRQIVQDRVDALLNTEYVPGQTTSNIGQLGTRILAAKDAQFAGEQAYNNVANIPRRIAIEQERVGQVIEITFQGARALGALQVAESVAASLSVQTGVEGALPTFTTNFNPLAPLVGALRLAQTMVQAVQESNINLANSAATVKNILLEQANARIELDRAKLRFDQEITQLELDFQRLDQLVNDYAETVLTAESLWFNDQTYRVQLSERIRRANLTLDRTIGSLFDLARALAYEWNEDYRNPVIVPPDVQGVAGTLGSALYDPFTQPEDLFGIQSAEEANDFFNALEAWDTKLRSIGTNGVSARGPNRNPVPFTNRPISLRDDVLGLVGDNNNPRNLNDRILLFREFLQSNLIEVPQQAPTPGFALIFGLTLEIPNEPVQPLLPFSNRWNLRVAAVTIDTEADSGYVQGPDCTYFLTQAGIVSNQTFFDSTRNLEERIVTKLSVPGADRPERSVFRAEIPSRVNGREQPGETYQRGQELSGGVNNTTARPLAATQWQLELDPTQPKNFATNITKLRDIKVTFQYFHGNPPEFAWP